MGVSSEHGTDKERHLFDDPKGKCVCGKTMAELLADEYAREAESPKEATAA